MVCTRSIFCDPIFTLKMNQAKQEAKEKGISLSVAIQEAHLASVKSKEAQRKEYTQRLEKSMPLCREFVTNDFISHLIDSGKTSGDLHQFMIVNWAKQYKECLEKPTPTEIAYQAQRIIGPNFQKKTFFEDDVPGSAQVYNPVEWKMSAL